MNIQSALSAALSGMKATQQQVAVASHNIANATNEGFVRKELAISTKVTAGNGEGVEVNGVTRNVDELLVRDARHEQSRYGGEEARASLLSDYTTAIGQPQDERSVSSAMAALQQAFQQLHSAPSSDSARAAVVTKANALVQNLHTTAAAADNARTDAQSRLEDSVKQVNSDLARISDLNKQISTQKATGADSTDLQDERDRLLDNVSKQIGIRTYTRDNGSVVVMTRNGQALLDRDLPPGAEPLKLVGSTLQVGTITINLTNAAQANQEIQTGQIMGYVRTEYQDVPKIVSQLDDLAANTIVQFQKAEANPALAGLFTDNGAALAVPAAGTPPTYTAGLAGRIAVNSAIDNNAWRVQSGVQTAAGSALPTGDQTQINKFLGAFNGTADFGAADLPATATIGSFATNLVSVHQGYRTAAEAQTDSLKISAETLQNARSNRDGVNTDSENAKLLLIEQSYAASAQVIQVAARMLDTLIQIGK